MSGMPTLDDQIGCWTGSGYGIGRQVANLQKTVTRIRRFTRFGDVKQLGIELGIIKVQSESLQEVIGTAMSRWEEIAGKKLVR